MKKKEFEWLKSWMTMRLTTTKILVGMILGFWIVSGGCFIYTWFMAFQNNGTMQFNINENGEMVQELFLMLFFISLHFITVLWILYEKKELNRRKNIIMRYANR